MARRPAKKAKATVRMRAQESATPSEAAVERAIHGIFKTELVDILKRLAVAIDDFIEVVDSEFVCHPSNCRVSRFDNPTATTTAARITALRGDALQRIIGAVDSGARLRPQLSEPLTCTAGPWINVPDWKAVPRRAPIVAQLIGWLSPNERSLVGMLGQISGTILERRCIAQTLELGLVRSVDPTAKQPVVRVPALARSPSALAVDFPLLSQTPLKEYEQAVSDAMLRTLSQLALRLRKWRHQRVVKRVLEPGWERYLGAFVRFDQAAPVEPFETPPTPHRLNAECLKDAAGIGAGTFYKIRIAAGITGVGTGWNSRGYTYSASEIKRMIKVVQEGNYQGGARIVERWQALLR